jgi:SnoaL-like domain
MRGAPSPHPDEATISALEDRVRIIDIGCRFLLSLDLRRWDGAMACCSDTLAVVWDISAGRSIECRGSDEAVAFFQSAMGASSYHQATNERAEINGEKATLRWYVTGRYRTPTMRGADTCTVFAEQQIALRRHGRDWRISEIRHTVLSIEGNPAAVTAAKPPLSTPAQLAFAPSPAPVDETPEQRLIRLTDQTAIYDLMMRFGRGLDQKDWPLYRSCFGNRLTLDFSRMTGEPAQMVDADLFVDFARLRQRSHFAFHQYANFQVSVDGDRASCVLSMVARHRIPQSGNGEPLNVFIGWYDNEFVRGPDGWKISVLRTPLQRVEGNALIKDSLDPEVEEASRRLFSKEETH